MQNVSQSKLDRLGQRKKVRTEWIYRAKPEPGPEATCLQTVLTSAHITGTSRPQGTHLLIVLSQQCREATCQTQHSHELQGQVERSPTVNTCQAAVHRAPAWTQVSIGSLNRATGLNSSFPFCPQLVIVYLFVHLSIHSSVCQANMLSDSPLRNLRFTGTLWDKNYVHTHFTHLKAEAWKNPLICSHKSKKCNFWRLSLNHMFNVKPRGKKKSSEEKSEFQRDLMKGEVTVVRKKTVTFHLPQYF